MNPPKTRRHSSLSKCTSAALLLAGTLSAPALANGTESLGTPVGITVASGTGTVAAGTGMHAQPASIALTVPQGTTVKQVLLYWEGQSIFPAPGDDAIVVNGLGVTGSLIGGPTVFFQSGSDLIQSSTFRADLTSLRLVAAGANTLTLQGMDFNFRNNGAELFVIYSDGSSQSSIALRDGNDLAFINFAPPLDTTVPQTFSFAPAPIARSARMTLFVGSIAVDRPESIAVTVAGNTTLYSDTLNSNDGLEWDTFVTSVAIPANASLLTVQIFSRDDHASGRLPASFAWIGASLTVPLPANRGCSPGYWKNHTRAWAQTGYSPTQTVGGVFSSAPSPLASRTLLQGLSFQGGSTINGASEILLRAGIAALLNSTHSGVNYPRTRLQVISGVNAALASKNRATILTLASALDLDNTMMCPLN